MKKSWYVFILILICCFVMTSCNNERNPSVKTIKKKIELIKIDSIDLAVDSLLTGNLACDKINYNYYLSNKKDEILETLINKIDFNYKIDLYEPKQYDIRISTLTMTKYYAGVKAMCLFNTIICDSMDILVRNKKSLCQVCITGINKSNGGNVDLNDLRKTKEYYENWFEKTKKMSSDDKRLSWISHYKQKLDSSFIKLW